MRVVAERPMPNIVATRMSRSSAPNFRSTTNLITHLERKIITNMLMSVHVAIVMAVDLFVGVTGARTAKDVEGIHMSKRRRC
jgi:hypothetical protein